MNRVSLASVVLPALGAATMVFWYAMSLSDLSGFEGGCTYPTALWLGTLVAGILLFAGGLGLMGYSFLRRRACGACNTPINPGIWVRLVADLT